MKYQNQIYLIQKYRFLFLFLLNLTFILLTRPKPIFAQTTTDPSIWQTTATGLKTQTNVDKKTAGLSFVVKDKGWPFLSLQGGVENVYGYLAGPIGIDLGLIKYPTGTATLTNEQTDWAHNEMIFSNESENLKLWVSRLSPAILIQSSANSIQLFTGDVTGNTFDGTVVSSKTTGPSYPKYIAYSSGGSVHVQKLPVNNLNLDQNWVLVWYGNNSHFVETKTPLSYTGFTYAMASIPHKDAYQADAPILLVFQNNPESISSASQGGVQLLFPSTSGYTAILPLFGRDRLEVSETEGWATSLPSTISVKARWWASHLCSFPTTVTETYAYNSTSDTTTITETLSNVLNICPGGTSFAYIPPMLGLVKDTLPITFSGNIADGNLFTEFGPILGIENTNSYSWSISGFKKYTDSQRVISETGQVPAELEQELASQVGKTITSGHLAPWIFENGLPSYLSGDIYFHSPADTIYYLSEVAESIDDTNLKKSLIDYIKSERDLYKPETISNLPLDEGTSRKGFSTSGSETYSEWQRLHPDIFLFKVPLYNFYALSKYYNITKEDIPAEVMQRANDVLDKEMQEQDWASFYWFDGYEPWVSGACGYIPSCKAAVVNANRNFDGLIGYITIAKQTGNNESENLGRGLFAKALVTRIAMAKYPRYLYTASLVKLPPEPDWQVRYTAGKWNGYIFNYNWTGPYDDVRQVTILNQFGTTLLDHQYFFTPFRDMTPELARAINDFARDDITIYINKAGTVFPHWYSTFVEGTLGGTGPGVNHPIDSYQIFMAKAWIEKESPDKLASYLDIPWLENGDLFYMQKLSETIKAYRGVSWSDVQASEPTTPTSPPTHCTPLGDIDCSGQVGILDLSTLLSSFGKKTGDTGFNLKTDLDNSGEITILDLSTLLSNFGRARP